MDWKNAAGRLILIIILSLVLILPVSGSVVDPTQQMEQIRSFSRIYEFDYVSWTVSALARKLVQSSLQVDRYLSPADKKSLVLDYLDLRNQTNILEGQLAQVISDPNHENGDELEKIIREELDQKRDRRIALAPYVEQVLQNQLNSALIELDLSLSGQLVPPVLYKSEPDSYALIVSPRDEIRQIANLMLVRGLTLDEIIQLEEAIESELDLSALVVGIGGVGLYPSMIIETGNLDWLIHVVSHEWTHNYLTVRPLGLFYVASPELTTINETVADLSADEIQLKTFELYYPEYLPSEPEVMDILPAPESENNETSPPAEPGFDFRDEMHLTRLEVDRMLAEGLIEEAETYLEERREVFWENGYQIRKLNQAYFAFHGSYAADPGGAADQEGADLGSQLRELKSRAPSYRFFMKQVAWRWRLDQFERLFERSR
ncbi:MAG: hypothetical protein HQ574_04300 [Chloroflexi bacterium]|nr:hypothetical protein [Chloroflexota bacterium]